MGNAQGSRLSVIYNGEYKNYTNLPLQADGRGSLSVLPLIAGSNELTVIVSDANGGGRRAP